MLSKMEKLNICCCYCVSDDVKATSKYCTWHPFSSFRFQCFFATFVFADGRWVAYSRTFGFSWRIFWNI